MAGNGAQVVVWETPEIFDYVAALQRGVPARHVVTLSGDTNVISPLRDELDTELAGLSECGELMRGRNYDIVYLAEEIARGLGEHWPSAKGAEVLDLRGVYMHAGEDISFLGRVVTYVLRRAGILDHAPPML